MTNAAKQLIDTFDALPEPEQQEVLAQLLRRLAAMPCPSVSDDELTQAADFVFQQYDRHEEKM